ncbi:putative efflux protein, MATE family [Sanguibacter gelidistatuariae]|uniref:Multidrug export protein MepA n=1 Tax=Sanguibacter gelidistatuariae TaxID=1814289 RepID=A0A1G6XGK6_9MICO|nr:MATE family efflux transporter [Sanguibacter gelidistatuariae]SDD77300.1 putative efflux protein, MATE family [Sanguibacter gelidistatuariae]
MTTPQAGPSHADFLGTRPVGRLLWNTSSQTTLSVGVYGIYALTNAWFVARGVGPTAMAAVNLVAPILLGLGAVSTTVGVGGASLVSRSLGAGDPARAARAAGNSFLVFWVAAVVTTVAGLLLLDPLLTLLGTTEATREYAHDYAVIILAGAIVSTGFSSLVRAEGRMLFSTMLWLVPIIVQMTLDPVLIFGFGLGVKGAALGTVGGQTVSALMSIWFFFVQRRRPYRIRWADLRPHRSTLVAILAVGSPSFLAGIGTTVLAVLVNVTLSRTGGATALAAFAICARLQTFVTMPQSGISQGLQPIVGYNAGAGLLGRVDRARTLSLRATVLYSVAAAVIVAVLADPLVSLFVTDPQTIDAGSQALRIIAIGVAAAGIAPLISAYFQSLGHARPSYLISIGTLVALKIPLVLFLGTTGPTGIWIALAAGEVTSAACALGILHVVRRRTTGITGKSEPWTVTRDEDAPTADREWSL